MGKEDRGSPVLISHLIHLRAQPLLRLSGSVAGAARSAGENSLLKESFRLQPDHRKKLCVSRGWALDLGNTGGNRANQSPTRPPDLWCDSRDLTHRGSSAASGSWEIIGADQHSRCSCPAGSTMHYSGRWIWWEKKIGDHPSIFPSNHLRAQPLAPPQRQRGRCCEDAGEKLPPQREFSPPVREEHTVCNVIYFRLIGLWYVCF